ncbi:hypothetical protein [Brevibacillus nitrificans]|uniref:hypothetical protein n=1 Tax=Brevibacillus nitrificans TaxID=651560 RepID=UPI002635AD29|nr:hypothetical protein [Brevibacillus nitrificans]MED1795647.1 hypothetical protein [Brevibacillus nitrificans]
MLQKWCARCKNHSFSSGDWYEWRCPYCNKNLTLQKAVPAVIRFVLIRPYTPRRFQQKDHKPSRSDENTA